MSATLLENSIRRAFPDISDSEATELLSIGEAHAYPPGKILCREGEIESTFYIVIEGEVQVNKIINESEMRMLKPLGPGDFFGEYALIHDAPRTATVMTTSPTTVLEIHKGDFARLLRNSTSVSLAMVREVSRRLRENDEMAIEDLRLKAGELAAAYQRLAEMDFARREFLTSVAHELRTPLTAANGFLQFIKKGMLKGDDLQTALNKVAENVQRITTLVNDILFLQEMDLIIQEPSSIEIGLMVSNVINDFRPEAEEMGIFIKSDISPEVPMVTGAQESLERAFKAILENAIKFSPDGGNVNVSLSLDNGFVVVRVQDYGVGIPEEVRSRIFDRFYHLERVGGHLFGGLGLGLSIAHHVVKQHQGEIFVDSELGKGSVFTIRLKALQEELAP
jgi:signal transduction histidine kinase